MFYVYILFSEKCGRFYIGYSNDVHARLIRHNAGLVTATKNCRPYILKTFKEFTTQKDAMTEEKRIKKQKSSKYILWLLDENW